MPSANGISSSFILQHAAFPNTQNLCSKEHLPSGSLVCSLIKADDSAIPVSLFFHHFDKHMLRIRFNKGKLTWQTAFIRFF